MKSLYEVDTYAWTLEQAQHLKNKEINMLDWNNLIEEIESLGRSEKRALESYLMNLLMHKLKMEYQPREKKYRRSWETTILNSKIFAYNVLKFNPSLKHSIKEIFFDAYKDAREKAAIETGIDIKIFPEECPWSLNEILGNE